MMDEQLTKITFLEQLKSPKIKYLEQLYGYEWGTLKFSEKLFKEQKISKKNYEGRKLDSEEVMKKIKMLIESHEN